MSAPFRPARVVSRRPLSARVSELLLEVGGEPSFRWHGGQHLAIHPEGGVATHEGPLWYSIASAWDGAEPPLLSLAIGPGTGAEALALAGPGTILPITGPFGSFALPAASGALLIGVGTGVAPLRAMVDEAITLGGDSPLLLVVGARTERDLLWHPEFSELSGRSPRFRYEPVLSQPEPGWAGRRGYVQEHLGELAAALPPGFLVRACGSVTMVESALKVLAELRVPRAQIAVESY